MSLHVFHCVVTLLSLMTLSACDGDTTSDRSDRSDAFMRLDMMTADQAPPEEDMGGSDQVEVDMTQEDLIPLSPQVDGPCGPHYRFLLPSGEEQSAFRGRVFSLEQTATCHPTRGLATEGALIELTSEQSGRYMLRVEHSAPVALEVADSCGAEREVVECALSAQGQIGALLELELSAERPIYLTLSRLIRAQRALEDFIIQLWPIISEPLQPRVARAVLGDAERGSGEVAQARLAVSVISAGLAQRLKEVELTLIDEGGTERTLPRIARQELSRLRVQGESFELVVSGLVSVSPAVHSVRVTLIDEEGGESAPLVAEVEVPERLYAGTPCDELGLAVCEAPLECATTIAGDTSSARVCQLMYTPELRHAEVALDLDEVKLGVVLSGVHQGLTEGSTLELLITLNRSDEEATPRVLRLEVTPELLPEGEFLIRETYSFFDDLFDLYGVYDHLISLQVRDQRGRESESIVVPLFSTQRCDIESLVQACGEPSPCLSLACTLACTPDEDEPSNNRRSSATLIDERALNSFERTICGGDHDYYQVTLYDQETLTLSMTGFDARSVTMVIELYDERGAMVASSLNGPLAWTHPQEGQSAQYFVKIKTYQALIVTRYVLYAERSSTANVGGCPLDWETEEVFVGTPISSDNSTSTITPESAGRCGGGGPVDVYLFTAPREGSYLITANSQATGVDLLMYAKRDCNGSSASDELACNDDTNGIQTSAFTLTLSQGERVYLFVDSFNGDHPGSYTLEVTGGQPMVVCMSDDRLEPNNSHQEATSWTEAAQINSSEPLKLCGDTDVYEVIVQPGETIAASVRVIQGNIRRELRFTLLDQALTPVSPLYLVRSRRTLNISNTASVPRTYYLQVVEETDQEATYELSFTAVLGSCLDDLEPNHLLNEMTNWPSPELGVHTESLSTCVGDSDLFTFELAPYHRLSVEVTFDEVADLEADLYSADGLLVSSSRSSTAVERVTYTNESSEVASLILDVYPYIPVESASYDITVTLEDLTPEFQTCLDEDRYEPNNTIDDAIPAALTRLIQPSETHTLCAQAEDYYQVQLLPREVITVQVSAVLGGELPIVDLVNEAGFSIADVSWDVSGARLITLVNSADSPEVAYLKLSTDGMEQVHYQLKIDRHSIDTCEDDDLEPNDRPVDATPSFESRAINPLEPLVACAGESDYYLITLQSGEGLSAVARFNPALVNLDLLVTRDGDRYQSSHSFTNSEEDVTHVNDTNAPIDVLIEVNVVNLHSGAVSSPYSLTFSFTGDDCSDAFEPNDTPNLISNVTRRDADNLSGQALKSCINDVDLYPIEVNAGESLSVIVTPSLYRARFDVSLYLNPYGAPIEDTSRDTRTYFSGPRVLQYTNNEADAQVVYVRVVNDETFNIIEPNYADYELELLFSNDPLCISDQYAEYNSSEHPAPSEVTAQLSSTEQLSACGNNNADFFEVLIPARSALRVTYQTLERLHAEWDYWLWLSDSTSHVRPDFDHFGNLIYHENLSDQDQVLTLEVYNPPAVRLLYSLDIDNGRPLCARDAYELNNSNSANGLNAATPHAQSAYIRSDELLTLCVNDVDYYQILLEPGETLQSSLTESDGVLLSLQRGADTTIEEYVSEVTYLNTSNQRETLYVIVAADDYTEEMTYRLDNIISGP